MTLWRSIFSVVMAVFIQGSAQAHEVRPSFLQLEQVAPQEFAILWKIPARGEAMLKLDVNLPEECQATTPQQVVRNTSAVVKTWRVRCADGLTGKTVRIPGLNTTAVETIARVDWMDRPSQNVRLTGGLDRFEVAGRTTVTDAAATYLPFGISHIWEGIDHLLFLVALFFLIGSLGQLLLAVTSFTVAHSLTLGLAVLGVVHVPSGLVETLIALSIVFVAAEAARGDRQPPTITRRWPWALAFAFGLFHGLGFAGALTEAGLPEDAIVPALLFFNLGVEIGQIAFIAGLSALLYVLGVVGTHVKATASRAALYTAGIAGMFWTLERTASLFGVFSA